MNKLESKRLLAAIKRRKSDLFGDRVERVVRHIDSAAGCPLYGHVHIEELCELIEHLLESK